MHRRLFLASVLAALLCPAALPRAADFAQIEQAAREQTVYFNAWGGAREINDYIAWAGEEVCVLSIRILNGRPGNARSGIQG